MHIFSMFRFALRHIIEAARIVCWRQHIEKGANDHWRRTVKSSLKITEFDVINMCDGHGECVNRVQYAPDVNTEHLQFQQNKKKTREVRSNE